MSFCPQRVPEVVLSEESRRLMTEQILRSKRPPLRMTCLPKSYKINRYKCAFRQAKGNHVQHKHN
jgi:hypothetical protein